MTTSNNHVQMWELDYKQVWELKNWYLWIVVLEKILESPLDCKEIKPVSPKGYQPWTFVGCWSWNSNTLASWWEEPTHSKRLWCWEKLQAEGVGDDRGWDDWMASLTQWTWVWANSAFKWVYLSFSPLLFTSLLFTAICKASSDYAV